MVVDVSREKNSATILRALWKEEQVTKSVAVLGCGPAGLMVAHAADLLGWDFRIYSKKQKSKLFGAQYLHEPIPYLSKGDGVMLTYELRGTPESYRHKVYGPTWDGTTSPEDYPEPHRAWDLRQAYEDLWFDYADEIEEKTFKYDFLKNWIKNRHDLVISTIPRTAFDSDNSHFQRTNVWAMGDGDYERVRMDRPAPFSVICDGTDQVEWYRVSNIFGFCTMEWPWLPNPQESVTPPARGAALVAKPLAYTGNAATDIIHLGRYAQWTKGVLTSDVYSAAVEVLKNDSL